MSRPLEEWDQEEGSDEASGIIETCMSYTAAVSVQGMERDIAMQDDGSSTEGGSVEIEEIGGPINVLYVTRSTPLDEPSQEELETVRRLQGSPIPEEDYSGPTAAADREADMIVRAGIAAPSYEDPPPYLPCYEPVEYRLQW